MDSQEHVLKIGALLLENIRLSGVRITSAFLFGSHAHGNARPDSDIDIALVSPDFTGFRFNDLGRVAKAIYFIDADIEVVPFKDSDFTPTNPLVEEILRTGLRLA